MKTQRGIAAGARAVGIVAFCMVGCLLVTLSLQAQDQSGEEKFSAMFAGQGALAGRTTTIDIYIQGYSNDQEVQQLAQILRSNGQDSLVSAVDKLPERGRIAMTGTTGSAVQVVRQHPLEGGRKIVLFSNRPMAFGEVSQNTRSTDYPFGIVILNLNEKGEGDGLLYGACKVRFNKDNELEVEHYGQAPARLMNVRLLK